MGGLISKNLQLQGAGGKVSLSRLMSQVGIVREFVCS